MIPKADILRAANELGLQPTIVEKDYVLGWVLNALGENELLSQWVLKGGTCLKKCFFETYRFSEDLDFTVPRPLDLGIGGIREGLLEVVRRVQRETGIRFPEDRVKVEAYTNPRGNPSYRGTIYYQGPLTLSAKSLQKIKFDITQDEILVAPTDQRPAHHPYRDALPTPRPVRTYALEEQLAEKTRALYERQGRARDVYDVVHIAWTYGDEIDWPRTAEIARQKFAFKQLPVPTKALVLGAIDHDVLRENWEQQLRRQLLALPDVQSFLEGLDETLDYLERSVVRQALPELPSKPGEGSVPRQRLWTPGARTGGFDQLEAIRFAARNRLCVTLVYDGRERLVEPYSLRRPATGNLLLYVHQRTKDGLPERGTRALDVSKLQSVRVSDTPFVARFRVEL